MTLQEYLSSRNISQLDFAKELSQLPLNISRYINGNRLPRREMMIRIFEVTQGAVTPNDFYDLPPLPGGGHSNGGGESA